LQLLSNYKKKEEEMQAFQKKYDIRIVPQGGAAAASR
jgi:hypothetical protein